MSKTFFGIVAVCLAIGVAGGQPGSLVSINGRALDERGAALSGVEIRAGLRVASTGPDGWFRIDSLPLVRTRFVARRVGYAPESLTVNVDGRRTDTLEFIMRPVAAALDQFDVVGTPVTSARLEGFEVRRAHKNGGQFVTREDLQRTMPRFMTDIIRRLQGVRLMDSLGVQLAVSTRGPKPNLTGRGGPIAPCVMRVAVDGILKESYFPLNTVSVEDVHGVEVYAGPATIPAEFSGARRDAGCGLIMIWTRSR